MPLNGRYVIVVLQLILLYNIVWYITYPCLSIYFLFSRDLP